MTSIRATHGRNIQETLYLLTIRGMRESIRKGMREPLKKCLAKPGWEVEIASRSKRSETETRCD